MRCADILDRLINLLKWPAAVAALAILPGSLAAAGRLLGKILQHPPALAPFAAGFLLYLAIWHLVLRRPSLPSVASTLEHEATHALFAWATLHRVVGFRASWWKGGEIAIRGRGNWLISLAPYFFPTLCLLAGLLLLTVPARWLVWCNALMGLTLAHHLTSTRRELHGAQTDLAKAGLLFSWLVLPTANLLTLSMVLSFSYGGPRELLVFLADAFRQTAALAAGLMGTGSVG